jgi:hypothetical protein|nr:MAG TPA: hypothetical protein [Caudoviricetes sp.]
MKERLKMIFDRIDILVVCIVFGYCLTIAEAYIGFWKGFAQCFVMTFLITEVCYTLRCNEKLKKELIEANWKLKDAESELESAHLEIDKKSKFVNFYTLLMKLWRERWKCERAKVNYCKRKITSIQLVDAMNHEEKEESEISEKIVELDKELDEFYAKK